ncbi:MAG: DUF2063 domain-containing protein [Gammaproteobacteria bacterium]
MTRSPESPGLHAYQTGFAARIRDPRGRPRPPGVPAPRMRVYEQLLFNNLDGFLLACFPITRRLLGARAWRRLLRRFFSEHRCASPLFRDIPEAFLDWLQAVAPEVFPERPYLYEFMHYEWLELAVATDPAEVVTASAGRDDDLLRGVPVLNPTARLALYRFPVHRIGPRFKPTAADDARHCYLVYRDPDDEVRFVVLTPVTAHLLALLQAQDLTGQAALKRVAEDLGHAEPEALVAMGHTLLQDLRLSGALTDVRRPHEPAE